MTEATVTDRLHALTLAQLDFWEEFRFHPEKPVSTVAHCVRFEGDVDAEALAGAIARTVAETDVLSLRFETAGNPDRPRQRLDPARAPVLRRIDLSGHADPEAEARALMQADIDAPLDLGHAPLSVQWLMKLSERRRFWYSRGHHIVLDGYSMALMEGRVARLYAAQVAGSDPGTPFGRFTDYLAEEEVYRSGPRAAKDGAFWRDYLSPTRDLPVLMKGGEDYGADPLAREVTLPGDTGPALRAAAAATGIGWPDLLTLLSAIYLRRTLRDLAQGPDAPLPVWLPYMSRMGSVAASVPALVVNILPFLVTVAGDTPLGETLDRLATELRRLRRHGRYRIEQIGTDQGLGRGARFFFSPLVNVLPFDPPEIPGASAAREVLAAGPGDGLNLTFAARSDASRMTLYIDADPKRTGPAELDRHAAALPAFVARALAPGGRASPADDLLSD